MGAWRFIPSLDGSKWPVSRFGHFTVGKRVPGSWIDGVGPRADLDSLKQRKKFPLPRIEPVA
jgi:hypothetical protein